MFEAEAEAHIASATHLLLEYPSESAASGEVEISSRIGEAERMMLAVLEQKVKFEDRSHEIARFRRR
jgi:hypothetical protein